LTEQLSSALVLTIIHSEMFKNVRGGNYVFHHVL